jgi:hypothetical protein
MANAAPLIDDLRRQAKEDVASLWEKARADADAHRAALAGQNEAKRNAAAQQLAANAAEFERAANLEAEGTARSVVGRAKAALADRLLALASRALPQLRSSGLLNALAAELPQRTWQRVTVNAAERAEAQALFPQAEVIAGDGIAGGIDAEVGAVRVRNTLEARLESAWSEILPGLMKEVLDVASHS